MALLGRVIFGHDREGSMNKSKLTRVLCACGIAAACVGGLSACSSNSSTNTSGLVAATVNGTEIMEDTVTNKVESIRAQAGLDDESSWGQWLADNSLTPEKVREQMIDSFVEQELIKEGAAEKGVTVDTAQVDSYIDSMKGRYADDAAWQDALSAAGFSEDEYRATIESSLLGEALQASFASDEVSEEDMLTYARMYSTYFNGAKRSSHILFSADDKEKAQDVLDRINAGELDFAEAATDYSQDPGSAAKGGDVGWDVLNKFVTEYTDALSSLEEGQVSDLVTSDYGIHIIKCTEVFTSPEELTSPDQLPEAFRDTITNMVSSSKQKTAYQEWLTSYKESADIQINDMPEGLPYAVDMSKFTPSEKSAAAAAASAATGSATSEASSDDQAASEGATASSTEDTSSDESASTDSAPSTSSQPAESSSTVTTK